jgi:SAM-dependent methyltransferase
MSTKMDANQIVESIPKRGIGGGCRQNHHPRVMVKPHVNHEYVISFVRQFKERSGHIPDFRVLDYGCGAGQVVEMGLEQGLHISGVETFYAGSYDKQIVCEKGLLAKSVFEIVDGRIPYPDAQFDFIIANQVFEHVPDLLRVLDEIHRVLKPGGHLLALFPHAGVIWEAHMSLPLTHWFPRASKMRFLWVFAWRCLGFGKFKYGKSRWAWTKHVLSWLDTFCFYRSCQEIRNNFERLFVMTHLESEYIRFRKLNSWCWRLLAPFPKSLNFVNAAIFRRMGGLVFLATKKSTKNCDAPM